MSSTGIAYVIREQEFKLASICNAGSFSLGTLSEPGKVMIKSLVMSI